MKNNFEYLLDSANSITVKTVKKNISSYLRLLAILIVPFSMQAEAQTGSKEFSSYVDLMFNYEQSETDDEFTVTRPATLSQPFGGSNGDVVDPLDTAMGFSALVGFRRDGWYGFEFGLGMSKDGDTDVEKQSFQFNTLFYPLDSSNLYLKLATGVTRYIDYQFQRDTFPIEKNNTDFFTLDVGAGVGYVFPIEIGDAQFGIRAEAVYLVGDRFIERDSDFNEDYDIPGKFEEVHFNLGVRFVL
jgi:hypothetical protein